MRDHRRGQRVENMWTKRNSATGQFMKSPKLGGSLRDVRRRPWWRRLLEVFRWEA